MKVIDIRHDREIMDSEVGKSEFYKAIDDTDMVNIELKTGYRIYMPLEEFLTITEPLGFKHGED